MLHEIHEQLTQEVRINTRTDTIFVITAIVFNFIMMAVSSALAGEAADARTDIDATATSLIVLIINIVISLLVNGVSIAGLMTGRATRQKLSSGLLRMYEDADVSKYYDAALLSNYMRRYVLFVTVIAVLGTASILIPLVVLVTA